MSKLHKSREIAQVMAASLALSGAAYLGTRAIGGPDKLPSPAQTNTRNDDPNKTPAGVIPSEVHPSLPLPAETGIDKGANQAPVDSTNAGETIPSGVPAEVLPPVAGVSPLPPEVINSVPRTPPGFGAK